MVTILRDLLRSYGWAILGSAGAVCFAWLGFVDFDLGWNWGSLPFFVASVAVVAAGLGTAARGRKWSKLESDVQSARKEADAARNELNQADDLYRATFERHLSGLLDSLGHGFRERVSVYSYSGECFELMARFSRNNDFRERSSRSRYPSDQGVVGEAAGTGESVIDELPDPETRMEDYVRAQTKWGVPEEVVLGMRMKSRSYAAFAIWDKVGVRTCAVVVFESLDPRCFDLGKLRSMFQAEEEHGEQQRLADFVRIRRPGNVSLKRAEEGGF